MTNPAALLTSFFLCITTATAEPQSRCDDMSSWDPIQNMCQPVAMKDMPMKMVMLQGNLFGVRAWTGRGNRGRAAYASTSMIMADFGTSIGDQHYLNLDLMLTGEKWLFPDAGYPLLLQIGEKNQNGVPFLDAQHPHSSPIMGVTLSDTITLNNQNNYLRLFFAPRGEATDGPIAFMHRSTGMINPDAPLGHHIGQDVGHITSTVIGASIKWNRTRYEFSASHGSEPSPEKVDLPLGAPNSYSVRLIHEFSPSLLAMISAARIESPEEGEGGFENRYSTSFYIDQSLNETWSFSNAFIYGLATQYDHTHYLSSFAEEFLFKAGAPRIWGRVEFLQRTGAELEIPTLLNSNQAHWVTAVTLGYTHGLLQFGAEKDFELSVGGSITKDLLPHEYLAAYQGNPWSGKVFFQLGGMKMWHHD